MWHALPFIFLWWARGTRVVRSHSNEKDLFNAFRLVFKFAECFSSGWILCNKLVTGVVKHPMFVYAFHLLPQAYLSLFIYAFSSELKSGTDSFIIKQRLLIQYNIFQRLLFIWENIAKIRLLPRTTWGVPNLHQKMDMTFCLELPCPTWTGTFIPATGGPSEAANNLKTIRNFTRIDAYKLCLK